MCDLVLPTSALGWVKVNDGMVGMAGTLSSLTGLYVQWAKTA
jgi:peroxin-11B